MTGIQLNPGWYSRVRTRGKKNMTDRGSEGFFINDRDQLIGHCFMEAVEWCREHPLYEGSVYFRERETDEWEDYPWPMREARSELAANAGGTQ